MSEPYKQRSGNIEICVDCVGEIAFGEAPDGADPDRVVKDIGEITLGQIGKDEPYFSSWYFCARCNTKLAGDRWPATVWWNAKLAPGEAYPTHEDVDVATRAALDCLLWSECDIDENGNGEPLDTCYEISDIAENDAVRVRVAVGDFLLDLAESGLLAAYRATQEMSQFGHDWVLTRNHHGAGFWDRGLGDLGKRITDLVQPYGEIHAYLGDDGLVHIDL